VINRDVIWLAFTGIVAAFALDALTQPSTREPGKPVPVSKPQEDENGGPLPHGAVARLGTKGGDVSALAVAPNNSVLAAANWGDSLRLWDAATYRLRRELRSHTTTVNSIAWSPDGSTLLCGSRNQRFRCWDAASGKEQSCFGQKPGGTSNAAWSADGRRVACERDQSAWVWDVRSRRVVREWPVGRDGRALALSPDGERLILSMLEQVVAVRVNTGDPLWRHEFKQDAEDFCYTSLAYSLDGRLLAGFSKKGGAVWDAATGRQLLILLREELTNECLGFSPDGRLLASGNMDARVRVWELATGRELVTLQGNRGKVTAVSWFPDSRRLASGADDGTVLIWDLAALAKPRSWTRGKPEALNALWADLGAEESAQGYAAVWSVTRARDEGVEFLKGRLSPITSPSEEELGRLVAGLDDRRFAVRVKASSTLRRLNRLAEPALRRALACKPSLELRRRAEELLGQLRTFPLRLDADKLRDSRAVAVLEQVATPKARQLLRELAGGARGAWLTEEARAALRRLDSKSVRRP
jgi:dipeptidyl aminopeptidase/acylaminoacyl peptidase